MTTAWLTRDSCLILWLFSLNLFTKIRKDAVNMPIEWLHFDEVALASDELREIEDNSFFRFGFFMLTLHRWKQ